MKTAKGVSATRLPPAPNPARDSPGRVLAHSPAADQPWTPTRRKPRRGGSARICLGHVEAGVDGCRRVPENAGLAMLREREWAALGSRILGGSHHPPAQVRAPVSPKEKGRCCPETHGRMKTAPQMAPKRTASSVYQEP